MKLRNAIVLAASMCLAMTLLAWKPNVALTQGSATAAVQPATQLVMFEQYACEWCEVWNEQVGVVYHKTREGKRAPLRRVDIHEDMPRDLKNLKPARFTPTFVLIQNGVEIGRIRGYPGEDFFWGMLEQLMSKLPVTGDDKV